MSFLTIITPTYNRAERLKDLYCSLEKQSNKDFDWIVVDDGSTDNTKEYIESLIGNSSFRVTYIHKDNGGKHTALNLGIKAITSELTFIVDSDDKLTEDAVEIIKSYHDKYKSHRDDSRLCGYSFLRAYSNGEINTGEFPVDEAIDSYLNQRINNGLLGDKAEVFYTEVIARYPFVEFDQEKFMPEDAVWLKMSGPYNMVHINKVIYISDYLEGGLTKSGRKMKIYSPYGMMYRSSVYINTPEVNLITKIKMYLLYVIYDHFSKIRDSEKMISGTERDQKHRLCAIKKGILYYMLYPIGIIIYWKWKR